MNLDNKIKSAIDQFKLNVNDICLFPPCWINTPDYSNGFKGAKVSLEQMQIETDRILDKCRIANEEINVRDVSSAANFLYRNQIGIDCSGFVYHLGDFILKSLNGLSYASYLFVKKQQIIDASAKDSWKKEYDLTKDEAELLPDLVSIDWVSKTFNKDPTSQVNVARLCSEENSIAVAGLSNIQAGDFVAMIKNSKHKHIAVVSTVRPDSIEIWDSYRQDSGYGGIMPHTIDLQDIDKPIEDQSWNDFEKSRYDSFKIRRAKAFSQISDI